MDFQHAVFSLYLTSSDLLISANPLISVIVDNDWRKDSLRDLDIFIPSHAKTQTEEGPENLNKLLPPEKTKEWTDIGINDLLGKYINSRDPANKTGQYGDTH